MAKEWTNTVDLGPVLAILDHTKPAILEQAVDVVAKKADKTIPRRTGATARTQTSGVQGGRGYVGYTSKKAVPLHERTKVRHRTGRAKWLETSLTGSAGAIRAIALREFRSALKR